MAPCRLAPLVVLLACSCGDDSGSEPDPGDGKVHPAPNGVHTSETQACARLQAALHDRAFELGCSTTLRPCPELLRAQFTTPCMEYDEGSVDGCVAYFATRPSCTELGAETCVVVPYPGTEPAGCPP
jgi:hypothetical protein